MRTGGVAALVLSLHGRSGAGAGEVDAPPEAQAAVEQLTVRLLSAVPKGVAREEYVAQLAPHSAGAR